MSRLSHRETTLEKLWRYRGVLTLISIPVLLMVVVMVGMPGSKLAGTNGSAEKFAVVIDAGSTGSRVHIFRFSTSGGRLELETDTFEQLKPGLSAYAENPSQSARSLKPLLDKAVATVPSNLQSSTSVEVRATAGLRLLPDGQADGILQAVRTYLKKEYPFKCSDESVSILDGADEGAFAWLTLNYLLGHLGGDESNTVAAIDMGGGSVQMAYAVDDATAKRAPSGYIFKLKGGGKNYNVYVRSQLGYGIMAGRAAVLDTTQAEGHPCIPNGFSGTYQYGGKAYPATYIAEGASMNSCSREVVSAMKTNEPCGPQGQCSFNGAWGGGMGHGAARVYVSSYLFDRGVETGIIGDTIMADANASMYKDMAERVCRMDVDEITSAFPAADAPYLCMDLSYCYSVLVNGFKIPESSKLTLVKQISYKGENLEAQWPLGAAINSLS
mmetsp:Transcript_3004/g.5427  ORF Transcript_3004/g.5427 Transcript_3004/m.5427 type:complete len:441 (-) Transcript_3004:141-1463(-)